MQSGLIDSENVSSVLRGISQKKQNGSLEINLPEQQIIIVFSNGKIVDGFTNEKTSVGRVFEKLQKGEYLEAGEIFPEHGDYEELLSLLGKTNNNGREVNLEFLGTIIRHDLLDFLFSINLNKAAVYSFNQHMPEYDRDFASAISVGQYLLDKASLESEEKRFNEIFRPGALILKLDLAGLMLSKEEQIMFDLLKDKTSLEEFVKISIFSRYHIVTNLLSFYERAIIEVDFEDGEMPLDLKVNPKVVDILEDSSERPYVEREFKPQSKNEHRARKQESSKKSSDEKTSIVKKSNLKQAKKAEEKTFVAESKNKSDRSSLAYQVTMFLYALGALLIIWLCWSDFINTF